MHLFTIKTSKKNRVFDIDFGKFLGFGLYFSYKRTKLDSDKRVIMRTYAVLLPFIKIECNTYLP